MELQKCAQCDKYLALDGAEIPKEEILGRETLTKPKMRTITVQLNEDVYEKLENLVSREVGKNKDASKLENEIVALGLRDYRSVNSLSSKPGTLSRVN